MKTMKTTIAALATASLFAVASTTHGAALVYEPFEAATGSLNGATAGTGSGTGLTGNWSATNTGVIETESFSYGDLQHTGNQASIDEGTSGNQSANASTTSALSTAGLLDDGATLWFSTMFKATAGSGSNEHSGFGLGTGNFGTTFNGVTQAGDGVGFYKQGNGLKAATWLGGGKQETVSGGSISITFGDSVLLVGKVEWGATNADDHTVTLYNPSTTDMATLGTGVSTTVSNFDQSLLDTVGFADKDSGGVQTYDEIRFGATLDDVTPVIPEPASMALMGVGTLLIAGRRRRNA